MDTERQELSFHLGNRRDHERQDLRTVGFVTTMSGQPFPGGEKIRVWTQDISESGTKLLARELIPHENFLLELLLPEYRDRVIVCEVIDQEIIEQLRTRITARTRVRFVEILPKANPSGDVQTA